MLRVIPIASDVKSGRFDLFAAILDSIGRCHEALHDGDVLVVSTKYVSNSKGRILDLRGVRVSDHGRRIARTYAIDMQTAEVILRESGHILGGIAGFVIATCAQFASSPPTPSLRHAITGGSRAQGTQDMQRGPARAFGLNPRSMVRNNGILAPNAGIDASNAKKGRVILYPDDPYEVAELTRRRALLDLGVHIGVILADSRLMPARTGTSGVAVACSGMNPVADCRSQPDLDGNPLKVTFQATADNIASIANHVMGEGAESKPLVIVRGSGARMTGRRAIPSAAVVSPEMCVYVRGLQAGSMNKGSILRGHGTAAH